ncbi:MAG: hypothetical protein Q8900_04295 [Bacillota bacterium]|nr:hypothetical protein [Bacillota bacterium]
MKKVNIKKIIFSIGFFVLGLAVIYGEGYYRTTLLKETGTLKVFLSTKNLKPVVFDVANEGIPKRIFQPGKISISSGHGPGIFYKGKDSVSVQVKSTGFEGDVNIDSTETSFDKNTGTFKKPLKSGSAVNLSVTLDIPRSKISSKVISSGNIEFTDTKSGKLLATVPLKIINSSVKK